MAKIEAWRTKIESALERRYGKSMLPLDLHQWNEAGFPEKWRCLDPENGAFIIVSLDGGRLRVVAEGGPQ